MAATRRRKRSVKVSAYKRKKPRRAAKRKASTTRAKRCPTCKKNHKQHGRCASRKRR